MGNPARALTKRGSHLAKRGDPTLLRAVALEWLKSFNEETVAKKFEIEPRTVARILSRDDIQQYISRRMIPLEDIAEVGARRLLEEALKTAFDDKVEWKERTENRKLLARTLLPEIKKVSVDHNHYIRAPARATSVEEWQAQLQAGGITPDVPVIEAEVIDEDE